MPPELPLPHAHAALFEFREITKDLGRLPEAAQILTLKHQLFQALERAADFQDRSRALEQEIDQVKAEANARAREHQAFAAQAAHELAKTKAQCEERLRATRREALAIDNAYLFAKNRCAELDELCHGLLATIERAARVDAPDHVPEDSSAPARATA